ncbi:hypothetical protein QBC43DRAFT_284080 [Cladorrhinum sp. PSN259]|nr:hypothetical protein QBC43DRAFT_284080 [Cladorrhinum sp. PSN259]
MVTLFGSLRGATHPWGAAGAAFKLYAAGKCVCDNFLVNEITETILEAMPMIAQVSGPSAAGTTGPDLFIFMYMPDKWGSLPAKLSLNPSSWY